MINLDDKRHQLVIRSLVESVPLCGCGSSEAMWMIIQAALERASKPWPKDDVSKRAGFYDAMDIARNDDEPIVLPPLAVEFVAQVLTTCDLMEHGGSVGGSWLTPQGKVLLEFLRIHPGPFEFDGPVPWAISCGTDETFELSAPELKRECEELTR